MKAAGAVLAALLLAAAAASAQVRVKDVAGSEVAITDASRVVSVAGALTEIVYALGAGDRLVGVDTTSQYPEAARALPTVGYQRTLSAEGLLSLRPSLVLASEEAGPPAALDHLARAGVTVLKISSHADAGLVPSRVRSVGQALGLETQAEALAGRVERELAELAARLSRAKARPSVLFLLAVGQGAPMVAGRATAADAMIRLAGGRNAVASYPGYKPLSQEIVISAAPDVILTTSQGLALIGGKEALLTQPAFAATPAARGERVLALDALFLLGFGPRVGEAARSIAAALHPELLAR